MSISKRLLCALLALVLTLSLGSCASLLGEAMGRDRDTPDTPAQPDTPDEPDEPDTPDEPASPDTPETPAAPSAPESPETALDQNRQADDRGFTVFPEGEYLEERFRTSEPLPEYDYVDHFRSNFIWGGTPAACSTGDVFYYYTEVLGSVGAEYLHYYDKATGLFGVLCGKPECTSSGPDCNGYMSTDAKGLSLYDGRLWWLDLTGLQVYSCALDGSDHRKGPTVSLDMVGYNRGRGGTPELYFHRGTMYWANSQDVVVYGEVHERSDVIAVPLDGSEPYIVYQALDVGYPNVHPYRDKLLLTLWNEGQGGVYLYDINTRKTETIFSGETGFIDSGGRAIIRDEGIYQSITVKLDEGVYTEGLRFLPWEGGEFVPAEFKGDVTDTRERSGLRVKYDFTGGTFTLSVMSVFGESILEASFPDVDVDVEVNQYMIWFLGWDSDCYYFILANSGLDTNDAAYIAISADGKSLTVIDMGKPPADTGDKPWKK